jgi:hypothetical protein
MTYLPEKTIKYKTYVKTALVEALQPVFANHTDQKLQNTRVTIDLPKDRQSFPSVIVRFYEQEIKNAGVGHEETLNTTRIQNLNIINATSGTFTLTFNNQTTNPIDFDATATDIKTALVALKGVNEEDVDIELVADSLYTVTFNSSYTNDVQLMSADSTNLIGFKTKVLITKKAYKFKHSIYNGDIEFVIYALSSLDRDLIADTIVQTIRYGDLTTYTNNFFSRIYPSDFGQFPDSIGHYININSDKIQGLNEAETKVPWESEDDLIYNSSYRVNIFGEFYSLPPEVSYEYISKVILYPYIEGVDPVPTIT